MKVATITFHNTTNYGAMLQCYALQKTLLDANVETEVIDYSSPYLGKPYKLSALKEKGLIKYVLGNLWTLLRSPRLKNFKKFRKKIRFTRRVNAQTISTLEDDFDLFITGSDQVWNGALVGYDSNYFLSFVQDKNKKGSYAASFGFMNVPEEKKAWYYDRLKNYKYYNVRESSAISILHDVVGVNANLVVDPTLLLKKEEWELIMEVPHYANPYILVYQLSPSPYLPQVAKKISEETGLKIIAVPFIMAAFFKYIPQFTAGPSEWLGLFHNAEYIVTDSFHGTAFSLIFEKKFWVCVKKGETRITSILNQLNLTNRIFNQEMQNTNFCVPIDYESVNLKMCHIRQNGLRQIKYMINEIK